MIARVERGDALRDFCRRDVFGTRIAAYHAAYSGLPDTGTAGASFYVQECDGIVTAALCGIDGAATLCCDAGADLEELRAFLAAWGFETVQCAEETARALGVSGETGCVVRFFAEDHIHTTPPRLWTAVDTDYAALYALLTRCGFALGAFDPWRADLSLRLRRGTAEIATVLRDGALAATVSALFITRDAVLLGAVGTDPAQRGQGLAGDAVGAMARRYTAKGRRVELLCRPALLPFYEKNGFVQVGTWCIFGKERSN